MIRNYIIIAWRNLHRNKFISFINIGGLAIGMPNFNDRLSDKDIVNVRNYILSRAKIKRENK
ncbi:MAG: hypothetical protein KAK04_03855 [Cyclobacteriaceae bacterium]|nr:hypothetical protein [Cyclobacteriaceae bacterium]